MKGRWKLATLALALAVTAIAAQLAGGSTSRTRATVYAAASLTDVFPKIAPSARYSFAGSNTLAAQIRQGAPADVFAAANMKLPRQLNDDGLCSRPVVFTRNSLVVVVPRRNPAKIQTVYDLQKRGVKVVMANSSVPVGSYTLEVVAKLKLNGILANVVSRESDVREVLAKVALGEADAGFVYSTDAKVVSKKVRVVKIPARGQPDVKYGMCVVSSSRHKAGANAFVKRVLGKAGQRILLRYGFLPRKSKPRR